MVQMILNYINILAFRISLLQLSWNFLLVIKDCEVKFSYLIRDHNC